MGLWYIASRRSNDPLLTPNNLRKVTRHCVRNNGSDLQIFSQQLIEPGQISENPELSNQSVSTLKQCPPIQETSFSVGSKPRNVASWIPEKRTLANACSPSATQSRITQRYWARAPRIERTYALKGSGSICPRGQHAGVG
jgi:hypothetical protein